MEDKTIEVGYETVTLEKVFGPLIFANIRIRANHEDCTWIIEREMYYLFDNDSVDSKYETIWQEWIRIPGQLYGDRENFFKTDLE